MPEVDDNLFSHLLEYQETDQFKSDAAIATEKFITHRREHGRKGARQYRIKHPNFAQLRMQAKKHKAELVKRQGGICYWCKEPMTDKIEVDHIVPLVKGGTSELSNLCVCHGRCNRKKASKTVKDAK